MMTTAPDNPRKNSAGFPRIAAFALALALAVAAAAPSAARAGAGVAADNAHEFHAAVVDATGHYREALFYVRRGNAAVAAFELDALVRKWDAVMDRFADAPPDAYAKDAKWRQSLQEIGQRARGGLAAAAAGKAKAARKYLEPIRRMFSELRRRNNVVLFADTIEDANAAFSDLFRFRRDPPDFTDEKQVKRLRGALRKTIDRYEKCRAAAPPKVADDPQFKRLIGDSLFYLDRIWVAIDEKNQLNVVNILRRVVSSDDILWLRYG